ncbi:MAG: DUF1826 domain-containing protein [Marinobacter sp.]|uniref:DUF1826 domain-containing protein n=1 Tax=Marinobacter sp. TaxID=50741 RepID=UPI00299ED9CD|nr:DUF1826 domain-containing protein [Marinobacter sp.]MDX1755283.1 DUF1826 domain-containing protein [Marinobacter sp.]
MIHAPARLSSPLAVTGNQPECLTDIFRDEVNLVIWERSPAPAWQAFVSRFCKEAGHLERFVSLEADDSAGQAIPDWARSLPGAGDWLADVDRLIDMYRCLFEPAAVGLRLHVLDGTMCPRFHVDRVPVRLLCTYQGPGTEWLPESAVNRPAGPGPLPAQGANDHQKRRVPTAAVALLKGEAWVGNEGRGLVHRSPAPDGTPRLVIGLDWLS